MTEYQITAPLHLRLRLNSGTIDIATSDEALAHVEVLPLRDTDACRNRAADVRQDLRDRRDGQELVVVAGEKGGLFGRSENCPLGFTIRVPHGSSLDCETGSASVEVRGRLGDTAIETASGDIRAGSVDGDATIKSASGEIELGDVAGSATVRSVSGDVRVSSVDGDTSVTLVSGELELGHAAADVYAKSVSGDLDLAAVEKGSVRAQSVSGDIVIGVARGASVFMDVSSLSGETLSDLDAIDAPSGDRQVAVEIKAKSTSGDIRLRRSSDRNSV